MLKLFRAISRSIWVSLKALSELNLLIHGFGLTAVVIGGAAFAFLLRLVPVFRSLPIWAVVIIGLAVPLLVVVTMLWLRANYNLQRYRAGERHFLSLANNNAAIDARLFKFLFVNVTSEILVGEGHDKNSLAQRAQTLESIESSLQTTNENIVGVLEFLKQLMKDYTGEDCACCIKLLGPIDDSNVVTLRVTGRDAASKNQRGNDQAQNIKSNTAFIRTLLEGKPYFACNDLKKLAAEGNYLNTRPNWQDYYNSSIVIPICNPLDVKSELGFVCVDSLTGKLDNEVCRHYTKELSCRLAVLVFRLSHLGSPTSSLPKKAKRTD